MTYAKAIEFLYDLRWFGAKFGLENTFKLAALAGNPQNQLRFIHVAGTNGKGSTCAMLESIYRAAGLRVGLFTSPHLVAFGERIQVNRQPISEADVARLIDEMQSLLGKFSVEHHSTFFEVVTVMALRYFDEQKCDLVIWETGMGGRLDATNIVTPLASVITNVQLDHQQWLGETVKKIAFEKAGIIKRNVPVICAEQTPEAIAVIERQAKRLQAPMHAAGQEWHVNIERGRLVYQDDRGLMDLAAPKLFGRHQFDNAGLAIATLRAQNLFKVDAAAFEAGIVNAEWPARMQRLASGALVEQAPQGSEIWLDGGHNAEGGRVTAAALGDLEERVSRPLVVIVGMMANKDAGAFLANFAGLTRHIVAVQIPDRLGAMPPDRLADAARALGMRVESAGSVEAALRSLARLVYEVPPRILITGSLYLAGHVLAANGTPPR